MYSFLRRALFFVAMLILADHPVLSLDQLDDAVSRLNAALSSGKLTSDPQIVAQAVAAIRQIEGSASVPDKVKVAAIPVFKASRVKSVGNQVAQEALIALQMIGYPDPVLEAYVDEIAATSDIQWVQTLVTVIDQQTANDRKRLRNINIQKLGDATVSLVAQAPSILEAPTAQYSDVLPRLEQLLVFPDVLDLTVTQRRQIILAAHDRAYVRPVFPTIDLTGPQAMRMWVDDLKSAIADLQSKIADNGYINIKNWATIMHVRILSALLMRDVPTDTDFMGGGAADWPAPTFIWKQVNGFSTVEKEALYADIVNIIIAHLDISRPPDGQGGPFLQSFMPVAIFAVTLGVRAKPVLPHIAKYFDSPYTGERDKAHDFYNRINATR